MSHAHLCQLHCMCEFATELWSVKKLLSTTMMMMLLKKAQYLGGWEKHFRFNFHFCRLSEIVENRLFDYFGLSKRREKSVSDTTMMMAEKICFMQFSEIDITWQMTSTFDFFFFVSSPPFHFPNNYALSQRCIGKRKIILTFCHRCRRRCRCCFILKDEEKIGHWHHFHLSDNEREREWGRNDDD